jgi:cell division protein FtsZ
VIDETLTDEMRITVIATGFDKEVVSVSSAAATNVMPATPPRFVSRPQDDLPRPMMGARADDLDVPTFIRKKAD